MDDSVGQLLAYALMVTRDLTMSCDAVHDAVSAASCVDVPASQRADLPWLLSLTRTECLRQLRARGVFIDTEQPVSPSADPLDSLTPGDRDALVLSRRSDVDMVEGARAMGCGQGEARRRADRAERMWSDAAALHALLTAHPAVCPVVSQVLVEAGAVGGVLMPAARRRLQRHAGTCARCRPTFMPARSDSLELLDIPVRVPVPEHLELRLRLTRDDPVRCAHLASRLGELDSGGFPVPLDRADRDPAAWVRRGALAAAVSAALLVVGLVAAALLSR